MTLETERDYEDPCVTQIAVFLQSRVGQLRDMLRSLDAEGILVHALSVTDNTDFAVVRVVVDRPEAARKTLRDSGFQASESAALAVEVPEARGGLLAICRSLIQGEINIHYAYPMFIQPRGRPVVVLHVDGLAAAADVLRKTGCHLLDEQDLRARS